MSDEASQSDRWVRFQREKLNVHYLETDAAVRKARRWVSKMSPRSVSIDFETAFNKPGFGNSLSGSLRLIQLGFDDPELGIEPVQFLIDCHRADPRPFNGFLASRQTETQVHNMNFEYEWALFHLGVRLGFVYDTLVAFRANQKRLRQLDPERAEAIVPGWEPHSNRLGDLVDRYLDLKMPKEEGASDWGADDLHAGQVVYAASDVAVMPPLADEAKRISSELDVADEIDLSVARAKERIAERVERSFARTGDDLVRCRRSMERCRSPRQLHRVYRSTLQMSIRADRRVELDELYKTRSAELAS